MTPDHDPTRTSPPDATVSRPADPSTVTAAAIRDLLTHTGVTVAPPALAGTVDPPPGFLLDREIGEGGMGVVYLARQVGLNRPVALKLVKGGRAVDAKALIRFLAEAEAVAAIKHPNVVEVYQYGEHAGKPFMALEYCPGGDLTKLVNREAKTSAADFRKVADLMAKVADGVHAAHAQGIVHRDLKPHNVFLTADGTPKVADFGLAKRGVGSDLTNTQAVMGTPAYMAPEQAGGGTKFVGPEADVWALGVMLYELCCGERPIDATGPLMDVLARVAKGDVSQLRTKAPAVPTDLSLIAHKCLSPDPRDRYPTAGGLANDLRKWLDGKPISARRAGVIEQAAKWAKRNKKLAGMGLAVLLTMAVATGVSLGFGLEANDQRKKADGKSGELAVALGEKTIAEDDANKKADDLAAQLKESERRIDLGRLREAEADFERNAIQSARDKLAAIAQENRCIAWGLLRRRVDGADLILRGHTDVVRCVAFSPDGRRVAMASGSTVWIWDTPAGQKAVDLKGHVGLVTSVGFSPDGKRIVSGSEDGTARVWDVATGRTLLELKHTGELSGLTFPTGGRREGPESEEGTARVPDLGDRQGGGELRHISPVTGVAFSPDGARVVTSSGGRARMWDVVTGRRLVELMGDDEKRAGSETGLAFSPDGRWVVTSSGQKAWVWDVTTGQSLLELKGHAGQVTSVGFSPDGRQVVTGSEDRTARVWDAATGKMLLELTGHTGTVTSVSFSVDGRRVVTGSWDRTVRVWDVATGRTLLDLKGHTWRVVSIGFSPDGRRVVTGSEDGTARVWELCLNQRAVCGSDQRYRAQAGDVVRCRAAGGDHTDHSPTLLPITSGNRALI